MTLKHRLPIFIIALIIQACGQTGPLYLPGGKAPIYVPPEPEEQEEVEEEEEEEEEEY
jgi:predicted small lipoprotein YifL